MSSVSHPATVFLFCYLSCTRNLTKPHCFGEENEKFFLGHSPRTPFLLQTAHKHPHQLRHWCVPAIEALGPLLSLLWTLRVSCPCWYLLLSWCHKSTTPALSILPVGQLSPERGRLQRTSLTLGTARSGRTHGQQSATSGWVRGRYRYLLLLSGAAALAAIAIWASWGPIDDELRRNFLSGHLSVVCLDVFLPFSK